MAAPAPAEVPQPQRSVIAVLAQEHGRIRELLAEVRSSSGEARGEAFGELRETLAAHETAEEIVLRPVSVQVMSRDAAADRNHEERRIVGQLSDLEQLDALEGPRWDELFGSFEQAVVQHLSKEETEEFPILQAQVDDQELGRMGHWITRASEMGPTHAHPLAAGHPTVARVATPFSALADKVRDLFESTRDED